MKNILKILSFFVLVIIFFISKATSIPVENVFQDITKDYKYYNEIQDLYNKGIIEPEKDHKWHPQKLLKRDEFVGIAMETSCNRCIIPMEDESLHKYDGKKPFFDVGLENKYYYCIADADSKKYVVGYEKNTKCQDGTWQENQSPFCVTNNIKLEEALAVIMRMGNILSHKEALEMIDDIKKHPTKYKDLSKDVKVFLKDGRVYSFYPYFKKALEFEVTRYDKYGNKKIYRFIEKSDYLHPQKYVTKEEFLKMAYIALKANSCSYFEDDKLALKINIYDKNCNKDLYKLKKCKKSDKKGRIFDFAGEVKGVCSTGIDEEKGYNWKFINIDTQETIERKGEFIDNYNFLKDGRYNVILKVVDKCGNTSESSMSIYIYGNDSIKKSFVVYIEAHPIIGKGPLEVNFNGIVIGTTGPYRYFWDFGDGKQAKQKIVKHIFVEKGIYKVKLIVVDKNGDKADALVSIKVLENDCKNDSDGDGINDCLDKCPLLYGKLENSGCPVFIKNKNLNLSVSNCEYSLKRTGYTFGNVVCDSCPCDYFIDFRANLRACDVIIPAITNNSEKTILKRGNSFTIGDIFK